MASGDRDRCPLRVPTGSRTAALRIAVRHQAGVGCGGAYGTLQTPGRSGSKHSAADRGIAGFPAGGYQVRDARPSQCGWVARPLFPVVFLFHLEPPQLEITAPAQSTGSPRSMVCRVNPCHCTRETEDAGPIFRFSPRVLDR